MHKVERMRCGFNGENCWKKYSCGFDPLIGRTMLRKAEAHAQVLGWAPDCAAISAPPRSMGLLLTVSSLSHPSLVCLSISALWSQPGSGKSCSSGKATWFIWKSTLSYVLTLWLPLILTQPCKFCVTRYIGPVGKLNLLRREALGLAHRSMASGLSCWNADFLLLRLEERERSPWSAVFTPYSRNNQSASEQALCEALSTLHSTK